MLINATDPEEARIAVVEDGVLLELHVEVAGREAYLGNIYKGRVVNIEPSIGAAFVAFGGRSNGFLHASDVLPAYSRDEFKLEDVITGRARLGADDGPDAVRAALADDDEDDDSADAPGDGVEAGPSAAAEDGPEEGPEESDDVLSGGEAAHGDEDGEHDADEDDVAESTPFGFADEDDETDAVEVDHDVVFGEDDDSHEADDEDLDADEEHDVDEEDEEEDDAESRPTAPDAAATPQSDGEPSDGEGGGSPPAKRRRRRRRSAASAESAGSEAESGGPETADSEAAGAGAEAPAAVEERPGRRRRGGAKSAPGGAAAGDDAEGGRRARRPRNRKVRPRSKVPIDQLVRKGQELIVQVTKEGIGSKGPTLTTYVSLPGRSLVLMPSLPKCGVSRKIDDQKERRRLKRIVKDLDETGNGGVGFIIRTNGTDKSKADLQRDRDYLKRIWELIGQRVSVTRAPALLYQESDLVLKAMRDLFSPDIDEVVVDSKDVYLRIKEFAEKLMPHMAERLKLHELVTPLFHGFGIEQEVEKLYQPHVELPNGGSIVIEQAEALVAIDVNSGRFKPGSDLAETAYRTNLEAIPEIVRQLRLRDLGGLIMIDFIDMSSEKHRRSIERKIIGALKGDRARIKVGRISPFGMLEVTRQRVGPGLKRTVFTTCRHCSGSGLVRTVQSKALHVLREVRALLNLKGFSILQVFVSPPVNDYLVNYKRRQILELEESVGKTVLFKAEPSYPVEAVHYRFMMGDGQEARVAIPAGLGVKT